MSEDKFPGAGLGNIDTARKAYAISKSDTVELPFTPRGVYVGGAGNISAVLMGDTDVVVFKNVVAGTVLPIRPKLVMTATTAADLVALY